MVLVFSAGKTIIPLLLDGVKMPRARELPRTIRELANFQPRRHRADADAAVGRTDQAVQLLLGTVLGRGGGGDDAQIQRIQDRSP